MSSLTANIPTRLILATGLLVSTLGTGCYEEGEEAKEYGEFRLNNESPNVMTLYVGSELRLTVSPGKRKSTRAPDGLTEVSVRTEAGKVVWKQYAEIPDNAFAQYNVKPDGSIVTSAGNIATPYMVGSSKEQVRLWNDAAYPVQVLVNGVVLGVVRPYLYGTFNTPRRETVTVSFRRQGGKTLFTQTLDIPRNGYIAYSVRPDGTVVATGGEIRENTQEKPRSPLGPGLF